MFRDPAGAPVGMARGGCGAARGSRDTHMRRPFSARLISQGQFAELKLLVRVFFPNGVFKSLLCLSNVYEDIKHSCW